MKLYHEYIKKKYPDSILHVIGSPKNLIRDEIHYYKKNFGMGENSLPVTEKTSSRILTLPMYPNMTNEEVYDVAVWINENLSYDQLILEYGGNNPWIHSSFNRAGNRSPSAGNKFGTRKSPGNYVWGVLLNMN